MRALRLFRQRWVRRRTWVSLCGRPRLGFPRSSGLRAARRVTAHAEAAIAFEAAVAIEDREPGEFDIDSLAACSGPPDHDAAEGVARRDRIRDAAFRIDAEHGGDLAPRLADRIRGARAHRLSERWGRKTKLLVGIHGPHEAQRALGSTGRGGGLFEVICRSGGWFVRDTSRRWLLLFASFHVLDVRWRLFLRSFGPFMRQQREQHGVAATAELFSLDTECRGRGARFEAGVRVEQCAVG